MALRGEKQWAVGSIFSLLFPGAAQCRERVAAEGELGGLAERALGVEQQRAQLVTPRGCRWMILESPLLNPTTYYRNPDRFPTFGRRARSAKSSGPDSVGRRGSEKIDKGLF